MGSSEHLTCYVHLNLLLYFSDAVQRYHPFTALNHLSKMSNFEGGYQKFLFKKAQQEADLGCRSTSFNESRPSTFTKEDVTGFDMNNYYSNLCATFPTLMTPMTAVAASGLFEDGTIEVLNQSEIVIIS